MTTIAKASLVALIGSSISLASGSQMAMYDVKSGKIEYGIKGSGEIMGSKMQTVGKKRVIFDDNGAKNLTEENKIEKQTIMGQKKTTKSHTMTYLKDGMVYHVNFDNKRIMRMENMGMAGLMGGGNNMKQTGESMMKKMGGKKIGTDKVLGYSCDVWNLMGTKQCMYKGIPLRVETNVMGLKNTEVATKAEFDISLSKDDFKLPDFPIYDMQGNKLDKSKLDAIDKKVKTDRAQDMDEMALKRAAFAKAMKDADIKDGQRPTKVQEQAMKNSMMGAMLPMMKKEILSEEKSVRFAKECLEDADTLKEANSCNRKLNEMSGESEEPFTSWNKQEKQEVMKEIDQYLDVVLPCVKKAQSAQMMQMCMPN